MLLLENDTSIISYNHRQPVFCLKRNNKRKRETIVDSGAYDVPKFIPTKNLGKYNSFILYFFFNIICKYSIKILYL